MQSPIGLSIISLHFSVAGRRGELASNPDLLDYPKVCGSLIVVYHATGKVSFTSNLRNKQIIALNKVINKASF